MRRILFVSVLLLALSSTVAGGARADDGHGAITGTGTLTSVVNYFNGLAAPANGAFPYQATWHGKLTGLIAGDCAAEEQGTITYPGFAIVLATGSALCTGTINGQAGSYEFDFVTSSSPTFGGSFTLTGLGGLAGVHGSAKYQGTNSPTGASLTYTATLSLHGFGFFGPAQANEGHGLIHGSGVISSSITNFTIVGQQGTDAIYQANWHATINGPLTGSCVAGEMGLINPDGSANVSGIARCTGSVNGRTGTFRFDLLTQEHPGSTGDSLAGTFTVTGLTGDLANLRGFSTFQGTAVQPNATLNYTSWLSLDTNGWNG